MYSSVQHIFFDLDNTLWDFETNSQVVINGMIDKYEITNKCKCTPTSFIKTYVLVNEDLWTRYRNHQITKKELRSSRFYNTMLHFGYDDQELGNELEFEYINNSPYQKNLFPGTIDTLDYLTEKYDLHIITNGFSEVQQIKLKNCGLDKYFDQIVISEEVGYNKPDKRIFEAALSKANTTSDYSVMIGDDWHADVIGASDAGFKSIFFNPKRKSLNTLNHPEIGTLEELKKMF